MKKNILPVILFLLFAQIIVAQKTKLVLPAAHAKELNCAVFTPDNRLLITGGKDDMVKIWDVATQRLYATIQGQAFEIKLAPDGKTVAFVGTQAIQIVDLNTFTVVQKITPTNEGSFWSIAYSPDGKMLYAGGNGYYHAYMWTVILSDYKVNMVYDYKDSVSYNQCFRKVSVSPDGKFVLASNMEIVGSMLLNAQTWKLEKTIPKETNAQVFTPEGFILTRKQISGKGGIFKLLDVNTLSVKQEIKIEEGDHYDFWFNKIDFARKGGDMLITNESGVWFYDAISRTVKKVLQKTYTDPRFEIVSLSADKKSFILGCASPEMYPIALNIEGVQNKTGIQFGKPIMWLWYLAASPVKSEIVVGNIGTSKKYLDLRADGFRMRNLQLKCDADFSPDGKTLATFTSNFKQMAFLDLPTNESKKVEFTNQSEVASVIFSSDGRYLANVFTDKIAIVEVKNQKIVFESKEQGKYMLPQCKKLGGFSPDSKQFVYMMSPQHPTKTDYSSEPNIYCINTETGATLWNKKYAAAGFRFTPDGKNIIAFDELNVSFRQNKVFNINPLTGEKTSEWDLRKDSSSYVFAVSSDAKTIINSTINNGIDVYDVATKSLIASIQGTTSNIKYLVFLKNKRYVVSICDDNYLRFYDLEQKKEIAKMVLFEDSTEWAVFTPDGRFDASSEALKSMYYVRGKDFIALESLYENFYTPKLLQSLLEGVDIGPAPIKVDDIKAPPSVKIGVPVNQRNLVVEDDKPSVRRYNMTSDKISLTIDANCEEGVTEIRLFQNGKCYGNGTRNLVVEDENKLEKSKSQKFDIQLIEGKNTFKAIAINAQRTESAPDEIIVVYTAPKASNAPNTEGVTLHLVVIGINKYKNPKYNLNYATADATSFKEAIEKNGTAIFSKTNVVLINDDKATKAGISAELEKVKMAAKVSDVFIFYYAGHGVLNEKKEFYLVPQDVTQLYGADDALAQKGLSAKELQQFSKNIKAQKQLFILDACQSAGAIDQVIAARGAAEEKAISQLARSTGTHWLMASGSEQFASEFTQLGHGTFTYVLLEALAGKADKGGDKKITVKELDAYLQEIVPEITAKYKGTPQYPSSYGLGNDFPIGVVKN